MLTTLTEASGRDFERLTMSYKAPLYDTALPAPDGGRKPLSGEPGQIAEDIRAFAAIGVHELIFDFRAETLADSVGRLERFARDVMPRLG